MGNKVLFAYDGPIYLNENGDYSDVSINNDLKKRYLQLGSTVTFMTRVKPIKEIHNSYNQKIDSEDFNVVEVVEFKSLKSYWKKLVAVNLIEDQVLTHDIIVARIPSAIGNIAIQKARRHNKPLMVENVGCTFDAYWNYAWYTKFFAHYKFHKQRRAMKKAPFAVYVTNKFLQERYPMAGKSIGCSNVYIEEREDNILTTRLLKIRDQKEIKKVGTVAALNVPFKAQEDVFKVMSILKKSSSLNFNYELIGQGNSLRLTRLAKHYGIENEVNIIGSLHKQGVYEYLQQWDLMIHPSKQEGLPRAVIEGMSFGLPVLGSDVAGIPELLAKEMLFQAGNVDQLLKQFTSLDKEKMSKVASDNFLRAKSYTASCLNDKRKKFYKDFLNHYNLNSDYCSCK